MESGGKHWSQLQGQASKRLTDTRTYKDSLATSWCVCARAHNSVILQFFLSALCFCALYDVFQIRLKAGASHPQLSAHRAAWRQKQVHSWTKSSESVPLENSWKIPTRQTWTISHLQLISIWIGWYYSWSPQKPQAKFHGSLVAECRRRLGEACWNLLRKSRWRLQWSAMSATDCATDCATDLENLGPFNIFQRPWQT